MLESDFYEILRALHEAAADVLLVGGLSAVINGAPTTTFDVDVVHSREPANIARLLPVLESLDAIFRIQPARRLKPAATHLSGKGRINLITRYGPLDLLGTIGDDLGYQDLLPHSTEMDIGGGVRIHVLNLEKLIEIKEELPGEKDRAMLPLLRRTLEMKKNQ
jgi:hypothetical protein